MNQNQCTTAEVSRRKFIARAGLSLATVSTLSRAVAQGAFANSRIRLGLVGCGRRGKFVLQQLQAHGGYEIVALADYFEKRTMETIASSKLTSVRRYGGLQSAEKMIAYLRPIFPRVA